MGVIKTNRDLDTTIVTIGAVILGILIVVGLFFIHFRSKDDSLLSPEIVMAIIAMPGLWLSYTVGKKTGMEMAERLKEEDK